MFVSKPLTKRTWKTEMTGGWDYGSESDGLWRHEVDETCSGSYPTADHDIHGTEPSDSATTVVVSFLCISYLTVPRSGIPLLEVRLAVFTMSNRSSKLGDKGCKFLNPPLNGKVVPVLNSLNTMP
jgi:hypothetical protein